MSAFGQLELISERGPALQKLESAGRCFLTLFIILLNHLLALHSLQRLTSSASPPLNLPLSTSTAYFDLASMSSTMTSPSTDSLTSYTSKTPLTKGSVRLMTTRVRLDDDVPFAPS